MHYCVFIHFEVHVVSCVSVYVYVHVCVCAYMLVCVHVSVCVFDRKSMKANCKSLLPFPVSFLRSP